MDAATTAPPPATKAAEGEPKYFITIELEIKKSLAIRPRYFSLTLDQIIKRELGHLKLEYGPISIWTEPASTRHNYVIVGDVKVSVEEDLLKQLLSGLEESLSALKHTSRGLVLTYDVKRWKDDPDDQPFILQIVDVVLDEIAQDKRWARSNAGS